MPVNKAHVQTCYESKRVPPFGSNGCQVCNWTHSQQLLQIVPHARTLRKARIQVQLMVFSGFSTHHILCGLVSYVVHNITYQKLPASLFPVVGKYSKNLEWWRPDTLVLWNVFRYQPCGICRGIVTATYQKIVHPDWWSLRACLQRCLISKNLLFLPDKNIPSDRARGQRHSPRSPPPAAPPYILQKNTKPCPLRPADKGWIERAGR